MKNKTGFTLIELLIVVAIIAILAAIAVVNFLEAQTRAKVTRVKADMRTLAIGLEAYSVDHNKYPDVVPDPAWPHPSKLGMMVNQYSRAAMALLSTPVAYLTSSRMVDPFASVGQPSTGLTGDMEYPPFFYGYLSTKATLDPLPTISNMNYLRDAMVPQSWLDSDLDAFLVHRWLLQSAGPDTKNYAREDRLHFVGIYEALTNRDNKDFIYDPSNGSISAGDIALSAKGLVQ